jgi:hypothetical protein
MWRITRWLLSAAFLGALVYIGVTVSLGEKTLWQHLRAIAGSEPSQELVEGVKQKADELIDKRQAASRPVGGDGDGGDRLTAQERRELRKLIRKQLDSGD